MCMYYILCLVTSLNIGFSIQGKEVVPIHQLDLIMCHTYLYVYLSIELGYHVTVISVEVQPQVIIIELVVG